VEEIAGCGIARTDRLSANALAAAVEPGGEDAGVVKDYEIAGLQQVRKVAELAVNPVAGGALHVQHAGGVAGRERFLGDEVIGQMEVEVGNQHGFRL